jgi:hypothetical protein
MDNANLYLIMAATALAAIALLASVSLRGFRAWLELKRAELDLARQAPLAPNATNRIEIADLKERIRKLEAIAAGVDL